VRAILCCKLLYAESAIIIAVKYHIIYRKTINNKATKKLQIDLNRMGEWAVDNVMIINPAKSKAVCFTRA
jgi:hypothetical protein